MRNKYLYFYFLLRGLIIFVIEKQELTRIKLLCQLLFLLHS